MEPRMDADKRRLLRTLVGWAEFHEAHAVSFKVPSWASFFCCGCEVELRAVSVPKQCLETSNKSAIRLASNEEFG